MAETESKELIVIQEIHPAEVFVPNGLDTVIAQINTALETLPPVDPATEKGRKEIASRAARIAKSKTYIDRVGKEYGEDLRKQVNVINAERKRAWDILESLQKEVRMPVTEFEERAKARVAAHDAALATIAERASSVAANWPTMPTIDIKAAIDWLDAQSDRNWEEFAQRAQSALSTARRDCVAYLEKRGVMDAEKAELERLRKESEERERADRERLIAEVAAAKARAEAEQAQRDADERAAKAEQSRIEAEKRAEEERIESAARAARERAESEERAKAQAEAAAKAERERIEAEYAAEQEAYAKREADEKHCEAILREIITALELEGVAESESAKIAWIIITGKIPHVKIEY